MFKYFFNLDTRIHTSPKEAGLAARRLGLGEGRCWGTCVGRAGRSPWVVGHHVRSPDADGGACLHGGLCFPRPILVGCQPLE